MALNRRVSLNDPEEDAIRRRQRLADSLMQQSVDPIQIQNYQGIQAPIPVTEGLNKVLAGALGGYEDKRATQEGEALRTRRKDEAAKYVKALDGWTNPDAGTPGNEAPAQVPLTPDARKQLLLQGLTSDNERVQGAAGTLYSSDQQEAQQKRALEAQQAAAQAAYQNQANLRGIPQAAPPAQVLPPDVEAQKIRMAQAGVKQNEMPSSLQEWAAFQKMSPEQQTQYLTMKRANPAINLGGSQQIVNPANPAGPPIANIPTTLKPGEEPAVRGAQSEASAAGTVTGTAAATAATGLPEAVASSDQTIKLLDSLKNHPGLSGVVGVPSIKGALQIPGTPEADFRALLKQVQGKQFLQAYTSLKGAGAISEPEGAKAEDAIARLQTAQTEDSFKNAVNDFEDVIRAGTERAKQKAGGNFQAPQGNAGAPPPTAPKIMRFDAQGNPIP